jgi:ABC-type sugar transport system permease subunit
MPAMALRPRNDPLSAERLWGPLYALPAVVMVCVFVGYPFVSVIYHAFTRWNGLEPPRLVGFHNFAVLIRDQLLFHALVNNVLFAISVPIQLVVPLVLAFYIYRQIPGWRIFRSAFFLPAVYPTVVVGILAQLTLQVDGPLNALLANAGIGFLAQDWLGNSGTAITMILLVVVWANFGYNVVLYLAGMSAIDPHVIEAAEIDGANSWHLLRHVFIPSLRRVMEIVLVTNTITAFASMFTYVYTITNGGPGFGTYVTEFYIYNQAFTFQNLGYACAIGAILTLIITAIGFVQIRVLTEGAK